MKEAQLRTYTNQMDSDPGKRKGINDQLDIAVYRWSIQQRNNGLPISDPVIKEKVLVLNRGLSDSKQFAASEGWLSNWKKRHGVRQLTVAGESRLANEKSAEKFKNKLMMMTQDEGLTPAAVYNADETGLFFKMLPSKTLAAKAEKEARRYKQQKERVTLMACCNVDDSHKLPLLVIGKSRKPQCFQNREMKTLLVAYCGQRKAWMDSDIFAKWFHENFVSDVKKELQKHKLPLQAVLLIDNAPSHSSDLSLQSSQVTYELLSFHPM